MGLFYFAARAFDILDKIDGNAEYLEGKVSDQSYSMVSF